MVVEGVLVCYIGEGDTFFIYNDYFDCLTLMYTPFRSSILSHIQQN